MWYYILYHMVITMVYMVINTILSSSDNVVIDTSYVVINTM